MSNFVNLLDIVYPVGSMYFNTNNTSPASTIGGTWVQIKDANIAANGSKYTSEYIGSYKIDKKQLPHHAHTIIANRAQSDLPMLDTYGDTQLEMWTTSANAGTHGTKHLTTTSFWLENSGGNQSFSAPDGSFAYTSGRKSSWINLLYAWQMPHGGGARILPVLIHLLCMETDCVNLASLKELVYNG